MLTTALSIIADIGISSLLTNMVATTTTKVGCKLIDKVAIGVGTFAIGAVISDATANYIQKQVDTITEAINDATCAEVIVEEETYGGEEISE